MLTGVKVSRSVILANRCDHRAGHPAHPTIVMAELAALVADDQIQHHSLRGLADGWAWTRGRLRRQLLTWMRGGHLPWVQDLSEDRLLSGVRLPAWLQTLVSEWSEEAAAKPVKSLTREQKRTTRVPPAYHSRTIHARVFPRDRDRDSRPRGCNP